MAKITISGTEEIKNKNPIVGDTGSKPAAGSSGSGTGNTGTGAGGGITADPDEGTFQPGGSVEKMREYYAMRQQGLEPGVFYPTGGHIGNSGTAGTGVNQSQKEAETSISKLKSDYARQIRDNYDYSAEKLKNERDEALRENWILQQRAEAALPEEMAAAGINGGAAETSLAALKAQFQGNRNDIRAGYMDNLGELSREHQNSAAEMQREYDEKWLEYLLSLARMEEQSKYDD